MEDLIRELKEVMKEKGLSPEKMSNFIGCSGKQIRRWLSGEANPTAIYQDVISKGIKKAKRL
ncbi:hypothetical protein ES702_07524 [subsurface metagenome]